MRRSAYERIFSRRRGGFFPHEYGAPQSVCVGKASKAKKAMRTGGKGEGVVVVVVTIVVAIVVVIREVVGGVTGGKDPPNGRTVRMNKRVAF